MATAKKRKVEQELAVEEVVAGEEEKKKEEEEEEEQVDYEESELQHQPQPEENPNPEGGDAKGEEEEEGDEGVEKLLESLSKEQLIFFLRAAVASNPNTLAEIRLVADQDPSRRKIFVHGLGWTTTAETLRSFFSQYGDIDDCKIITDRSTGKSKGYGFLLFRHGRSAHRALKEPQKLIDGRMTACQLASTGPAATPSTTVSHQTPPPAAPTPHQYQQQQQKTAYSGPHDALARKIFVGNVHADIDRDRLVEFFSKYGEIEEGPLGFDRQTGKPRGFALFIYRTVEGAKKALEEPNKNFEGQLLYCQKATDSHKAKAAVAAAPTSGVPTVPGNVGYNAPPGSTVGFSGPMDLGLMQGFLGAPLPFGQGLQANPAALAMLVAAGQNPAAFGVSPAMIASLNPALAAALNPGGHPGVPPAPVPVQGFGVGNAGYQNVGYQGPPVQQGGGSYQGAPMAQAPAMRPPVGPMGGYGPH